MKLLWLSHFIPYPPRGGAHQRSFHLLRNISEQREVHLFALNLQGESEARAAEYARELRRFCAEVEIWPPPYPWRGARWWAQLALSPFYREPYGARALWSAALDRRWQSVLQRHPGSLVHFDSIDLALYFPAVRRLADFRAVLNHHNCESAMAARRAAQEPNLLKRLYLAGQAAKLRRLEAALCPQFDANLAVSQLDAQTLQAIAPRARFHIVENGTDTDYFHPSPSPPEPNTLVFAGSLNWYPNLSGIRYFWDKVLPLVASGSPGVRLYLAGQRPEPWIAALAAANSNVTLIPDPPDIRPAIARGCVFVCPVTEGGGTKLKILDALAMGKAVVTTTIGAEGLQLTPGKHLLVADNPEAFAQAVLRLLGDAALREKLGAQGRAAIEEYYSWDVVGRHLERACRGALEGSDVNVGSFPPAGGAGLP